MTTNSLVTILSSTSNLLFSKNRLLFDRTVKICSRQPSYSYKSIGRNHTNVCVGSHKYDESTSTRLTCSNIILLIMWKNAHFNTSWCAEHTNFHDDSMFAGMLH